MVGGGVDNLLGVSHRVLEYFQYMGDSVCEPVVGCVVVVFDISSEAAVRVNERGELNSGWNIDDDGDESVGVSEGRLIGGGQTSKKSELMSPLKNPIFWTFFGPIVGKIFDERYENSTTGNERRKIFRIDW